MVADCFFPLMGVRDYDLQMVIDQDDSSSESARRTLPEQRIPLDLFGVEGAARSVDTIPVYISYEIIRLFSEGLYQSPQKAVEELVSNSYDANATRVHVLLPETAHDKPERPLWVIDNGHGIDRDGFFQLWRVADSKKAGFSNGQGRRPPIGQFGIGKLAAYVLAWRLTHISCVDGKIRLTTMNFRRLSGLHQYDNTQPLDLDLKEVDEAEAKEILSDVRERDPQAWIMMFGAKRTKSWTAAALSDFKDLYDKLSAGRLGWVLSTGLPLHGSFKIYLDGREVESSKERYEPIYEYRVGADDSVAITMGLPQTGGSIRIDGISGEIAGVAKIYKKRLTEGKSDQYGRSNGFFVRVRGRIINLEDELFGIAALNHSAWSRFEMELSADGLRDHLLSSREGVRDSVAVAELRKYMHGVFNVCRRKYEEWENGQKKGIDIQRLLNDAPSTYVTEPLIEGVKQVVESDEESFYVGRPAMPENLDRNDWIREFSIQASNTPFEQLVFEKTGIYDRVIRYIPDARTLVINVEHPFIEKLIASSRTQAPATLFGSAELLVEVMMQEHGFSRAAIVDFLSDRDRILRIVAGDEPSTAAEVLRLLASATVNATALERAVGQAFRVLGFEYERRGGNDEGPDGVLYARLGRGIEQLTDYKVVYDSKQTNKPSVPADKIHPESLEDFRRTEDADYGFFVAVAYEAELDNAGKLNRCIANAVKNGQSITLLKLEHLRRLVEMHYRYGITLTRLRSLFAGAHTVPEVNRWLNELEEELSTQAPQVPLTRLLVGLEASKSDQNATPNVYAVRALDAQLQEFTPDRLIAALKAVETIVGVRWLEVENGGGVRLHHTAGQIVAEVERHLKDLLGVNAMERSPIR
jgi:hypothetical protein